MQTVSIWRSRRRAFILRDGHDYFTVSVEDTGTGIAPGLLPGIMESFAMTGSSSGGRYGGTGLSLTVANKLCQIMGGYIDVTSRIGRGSRFTVILPTEADETEPARELEQDRVNAA
jgi:signal transduction histidine kinase